MKTNIFLLLSLLILFVACKKEDPEVKYLSTYPISGEWFVNLYLEANPGAGDWEAQNSSLATIYTYNTASNKGDSIWIFDNGNILDFRIKSAINVARRTFSVDNYIDLVSDTLVSVSNGKVIENAGKTLSGNKSDSITMDVVYKRDPSTIYRIAGHRRTGFLEDEP